MSQAKIQARSKKASGVRLDKSDFKKSSKESRDQRFKVKKLNFRFKGNLYRLGLIRAQSSQAQAKKVAENLANDKITQDNMENKEIIALIAYLQRLGTDIKVKEPSK